VNYKRQTERSGRSFNALRLNYETKYNQVLIALLVGAFSCPENLRSLMGRQSHEGLRRTYAHARACWRWGRGHVAAAINPETAGGRKTPRDRAEARDFRDREDS
jgi:hypothetical protein